MGDGNLNRNLLREYVFAAGIGGILYVLLEILWRGFTHPSMLLAGALSAMWLYFLRARWGHTHLFVQCFLGMTGITLIELAVGCVVNLWLGLEVWYYGDMPYNLWGQICPTFSVLWFFLSLPALWLCEKIRGLCRWMGRDSSLETENWQEVRE